MSKARVSLLVGVAVIAAVFGVLSASSAPAQTVASNAQVTPVAVQFASVAATTPYALYQVPLTVGSLTYADNITTDGLGAPSTTVSSSLLYVLPDGARLQVWQTNNPDLAAEGKDPTTAPGVTPAVISGSTWEFGSVRGDPAHSVASTRTASGDTISIDASIPIDQLKAIAAELSTTAK